MSEPISPELVLVDPELARAERARLLSLMFVKAAPPLNEPELPVHVNDAHVRALEAQVAVLTAQVRALDGGVHALEAQVLATAQQPDSRRRRKRVASIVLPISLIVNAILIAVALAASHVGEPSSTAPTAGPTREKLRVPQTSARGPSKSAQKGRRRRRAPVIHPTIPAVERMVLSAVVQSPAGKLPARLIDRKTGLAKNVLQAICRRSATRLFLCIVRPTQHKPGEGLYVRYRAGRDGRGAFTWYRYRRDAGR